MGVLYATKRRVYNKKFKLKSINHFAVGFSSVSKVAEIKKLPKQILDRWIRTYRKFGGSGLENKKPGVKEIKIRE